VEHNLILWEADLFLPCAKSIHCNASDVKLEIRRHLIDALIKLTYNLSVVSIMSKTDTQKLDVIPANKVVVATVALRGISPISFGRHHETPPLSEDESKDAQERRTFRNKAHFSNSGEMYLPPMMLKKSLQEAASYLSLSIPGKGQSKYTKHFLAGVLVLELAPLTWEGKPLKIANAREEVFFVSSTGKAGSGSRVKRHFPTVDQWEVVVQYHILDGTITPAVFERVLGAAGRFIGIGRFRPVNGGYYGRFQILDVKYETLVG
jgi:hypothetical protein